MSNTFKFKKLPLIIGVSLVGGLQMTASHAAFEMIVTNPEPVVTSEQKAPPKVVIEINGGASSNVVIPVTKTQFNEREIAMQFQRLSFVGDIPAFLDSGFSSGTNLRLSDAATLFNKPGWTFIKHTIDDPIVTWAKREFWLSELNHLATLSNMYFVIDFDKKTIEATKTPMMFNYTLRAGERLSEELSRWAEMSGWTMLWELRYDFIIESKTTFRGAFEEAVIDVVRAYQANGELLMVSPRVSKHNNTVKIEEHRERR